MAPRHQRLDVPALTRLTEDAVLLERDHFGIKVLQLPGGTMLKIFRAKRWFSSAIFRPYSTRFFRNAQELSRRGIPTLVPLALYRLPEWKKTAVEYQPLPGMTLRQAIAEHTRPTLGFELGRFVAELHEKGIYFRSLHLGNIILMPGGRLGLIDIADTRFQASSLSSWQRLRNFMHLRRLQKDRLQLETLGWPQFCDGYWSLATVPARHAEKLLKRMQDLAGAAP